MRKAAVIVALLMFAGVSAGAQGPLKGFQVEDGFEGGYIGGSTDVVNVTFDNHVAKELPVYTRLEVSAANVTVTGEEFNVTARTVSRNSSTARRTDLSCTGEDRPESYVYFCNASDAILPRSTGPGGPSSNRLVLRMRSAVNIAPGDYRFDLGVLSRIGEPGTEKNETVEGGVSFLQVGSVNLTLNTTEESTVHAGTVSTFYTGSPGTMIPVKGVVADVSGGEVVSGKVRIGYIESEVSGLVEDTLQVFYFNTSTQTWEPVPTNLNTDENYAEFSAGHFSTYALFGEPVTDTGDNDPPQAGFTGPGTVKVGEEAVFDASRTSDPEGSIETYSWSFGGSGVTASTSFEETGEHTVTLRVTDSGGATDTASKTVQVVENLPPSASIDASRTEVTTGTQVRFSAFDSRDPDGDIVKYDWSNGETGVQTLITFEQPGTREVSLTVTDDKGKEDTATVQVTVTAPGQVNQEEGGGGTEEETPGREGSPGTATPAGAITANPSTTGGIIIFLLLAVIGVLQYLGRIDVREWV